MLLIIFYFIKIDFFTKNRTPLNWLIRHSIQDQRTHPHALAKICELIHLRLSKNARLSFVNFQRYRMTLMLFDDLRVCIRGYTTVIAKL